MRTPTDIRWGKRLDYAYHTSRSARRRLLGENSIKVARRRFRGRPTREVVKALAPLPRPELSARVCSSNNYCGCLRRWPCYKPYNKMSPDHPTTDRCSFLEDPPHHAHNALVQIKQHATASYADCAIYSISTKSTIMKKINVGHHFTWAATAPRSRLRLEP